MKTWILEEFWPDTDHIFLHPDGTFEHLSATEQVHAVKPIKPTLSDHIDYLERDIAYNGHIQGLLADAEALNDEIEHLRAVAHRAQQRELRATQSLEEFAVGIKVALDYSRGSEAQVRCLEEIGQDALTYLKAGQ